MITGNTITNSGVNGIDISNAFPSKGAPPAPARGICSVLRIIGCVLLLAIALFLLRVSRAHAQAQQPSNCSGTATSTAGAIVFPTSGETGPTAPASYVTITNPSGTATLWVNAAKSGTATANTAGSMALSPVGGVGVNGVSWSTQLGYSPPLTISILSSAATSPFTCWFR